MTCSDGSAAKLMPAQVRTANNAAVTARTRCAIRLETEDSFLSMGMPPCWRERDGLHRAAAISRGVEPNEAPRPRGGFRWCNSCTTATTHIRLERNGLLTAIMQVYCSTAGSDPAKWAASEMERIAVNDSLRNDSTCCAAV